MSSGFVLICDDDPLLTDLLEYRLGGRGYETAVAHDGGAALEMLDQRCPDAIILGVMIPVVDGHELLRRVRESERLKEVPVIMLSARKGERDIIQALELGADDYVTKPFIPDELMARLTRLIVRNRPG